MRDEAIDVMFEGRPGARALFYEVRRYIESLDPVTIEFTKSQASFRNRSKFAWVWLPQRHVRERSEVGIVLTFGLDRKIDDRQIAEAVEPYPGRWTHHVVIEEEYDLNEKLRGWLWEAYGFGMRRGKAPRPKR